MNNINDEKFREYTVECIKSIPEHSLKSNRLECVNTVTEYCNLLNDDIETKDIVKEYMDMIEYFCGEQDWS